MNQTKNKSFPRTHTLLQVQSLNSLIYSISAIKKFDFFKVASTEQSENENE